MPYVVFVLVLCCTLAVERVGAIFTPVNTAALKSAVDSCLEEDGQDGDCPSFAATNDDTGNPYGAIGAWDVSKVTDLTRVFQGKAAFNQDISKWNVSNVFSLYATFQGANAFNSDLSAWEVSKVVNMYQTFMSAHSFTSNISTWDVSKVTNLQLTFHEAYAFNSDLSTWQVSKVTTLANTFYGARSFDSDLSTWDVSRVNTLANTFCRAISFNSDLSTWDVSRVNTLANTFHGARYFNSDLSTWGVSKVQSLSYTFAGAASFNGDVSTWSTRNVDTMQFLFNDANVFNQSIARWDVSKVRFFANMFSGDQDFEQGAWCSSSWQQAKEDELIENKDLPDGNRIFCCDPGSFWDYSENRDLVTKDPSTQGKTYIVPDSNACSRCVPGQYMHAINLASACKKCPRNMIQPNYRQDQCERCPTGQFSNDGKICTFCGAGTFTQTGETRTNCIMCVPGKYQDNSIHEKCFHCPTGWYQKEEKKTFCLPCVPGEFQNASGQSSCQQCAANTISAETNSSSCLNCPNGRFSGEGEASCSPCVAGAIMNSTTKACSDCNKGQYRGSTDNNDECIYCPTGWYQKEEKQVFCLPCVPGEFQNASGQSSCEQCSTNTISEETNSTRCLNCPNGRLSNKAKGSTTCNAVPPGSYIVDGGVKVCNPGHFCKGEAAPRTPCSKGTYTNNTGSVACIPCSPGTLSSKAGSVECDNCPSGYLQPEPKQSTCEPVQPGSIVGKGGSSSVVVPLGSKIDATAPSGFVACPAGTKGSPTPDEFCKNCPSGTSSTPGATTCQACDKGKFNGNSGGTCRNCVLETFQDQSARTSCKNCPAGWKQPNEGSFACVSLNWKTPSSCTDTQYLNNTATEASLWDCQQCPTGGDCIGPTVSTNIRPRFGWWKIPMEERTASFTEFFAECLYPPACPGAPDASETELAPLNATKPTCAMQLGFRNSSRLCQSCAPGHSRTSRSSCVPCTTSKDNSSNTVILVFAVLGILVLFIVLNALRMRSFRTFDAQRRRKSLHSTIKRIVLSHLQMVSIVLGLSVPWPTLMENVLNTVSSVASFSEGINSFECVYQGIDHSEFYNGVLVFAAVGPLFSTGVIALYWFGLVQCCGPLKCGSRIQSDVGGVGGVGGVGEGPTTNGRTTRTTGTTRTTTTATATATRTTTKAPKKIVTYTNTDAFISSSVLLCFFMLPSIVTLGTTFLRCYDVGGQSFVYIDLEKECYQGSHLLYSLLVAWPMILLYGALMPGGVMLRLRRAGVARSTDPHLMLRWGMLHSGYRPSKYWWELVVLLRKYSIIMLVTFNSKGAYQLHLALGIIIVALHLHDSQRPFGHRHVDPTNAVLHRYEMGSLLVLLGMLWCAGFFSLDLCHTQHGWCDCMVVVVLVGNFLLVGVLMAMFVKEWCKRKKLDQKILKMIEKRRSSRRSGSAEVGGQHPRGLSAHGVVNRESGGLVEGEVNTRMHGENAVAVKTDFTNPMLSSAQTAAMVQQAGEGCGSATTTTVLKEKNDEHQILADPATGRRYSWNTHTDETCWIEEEEVEVGIEEEEILTDPVSGRRYVHHMPSGDTTWLDG